MLRLFAWGLLAALLTTVLLVVFVLRDLNAPSAAIPDNRSSYETDPFVTMELSDGDRGFFDSVEDGERLKGGATGIIVTQNWDGVSFDAFLEAVANARVLGVEFVATDPLPGSERLQGWKLVDGKRSAVTMSYSRTSRKVALKLRSISTVLIVESDSEDLVGRVADAAGLSHE